MRKLPPQVVVDHLVESLHEQRFRLLASVRNLEHVLATSAIIHAKPTSVRTPLVEMDCESSAVSHARGEAAASAREAQLRSAAAPDAPERGAIPSAWKFIA
jgi:hypothetical protein